MTERGACIQSAQLAVILSERSVISVPICHAEPDRLVVGKVKKGLTRYAIGCIILAELSVKRALIICRTL